MCWSLQPRGVHAEKRLLFAQAALSNADLPSYNFSLSAKAIHLLAWVSLLVCNPLKAGKSTS
jgi:hypothetical protein